jgi:hypothetical protein
VNCIGECEPCRLLCLGVLFGDDLGLDIGQLATGKLIAAGGAPNAHGRENRLRRNGKYAGDDAHALAGAGYMLALPRGDLRGGLELAEKSLALNPSSG